MNGYRKNIQLRNFIDKVHLLDTTFEWLIVLITIFQAGILQYVMWLWRPDVKLEYIITTKLLVMLILPFVFSLASWIIGYVNNTIEWAFRFRMFSWGTMYLCIIMNISILYHYIFDVFIVSTSKMIGYEVYPSLEGTHFLLLTIFLGIILSLIPTYVTFLYNNTTLIYRKLNNVFEMIIIPSMGMYIPLLIMIMIDYWMFPKVDLQLLKH